MAPSSDPPVRREEEQDGLSVSCPRIIRPELVAVDVDRRQFGDAALHR